ncbi:uncharacterized protein LOC116289751 [Actinia tenebrosa]|uniref:Uncharacterized protein LOC116289751 n=1 Tax=Actinia tenebrosa TaxID=6105 RepID=A0A6P8HIY1_ACTTE|nr:uncharacterized protein LOC116289751 [Actinia tenebrosa]
MLAEVTTQIKFWMNMENRRYFLLYLWFCIFMTLTTARTLCPRIFFQNIDEGKMPYKVIEGVFVKQSYNYNGFPVYKHEDSTVFFYYSKASAGGSLHFAYGSNYNNYFGVGATVLSYVRPSVWLASSASLDRDDVFSGLISQWFYWNDRDKQNYYATTPPTIKAICVDEDFRECNSDRVYLNVTFHDGKGNTLINASMDYFIRMPGEFSYLRPVYKYYKQSWYLLYTSDQYWVVTRTRYPISSHDDTGAYMRVKDLALRPEYITKTWSVYYNVWRDNYSLKVKCRGIGSMTDKCHTSPCRSGSTCVYTSGNETLCICAPGYMGVRCDIKKVCSKPQPYYTEIGFNFAGNRPGDLAMTFCKGSYPSKRYALCEDGNYWSRQGTSCTSAERFTTERPIYTYPRRVHTSESKPINFDDIPGLTPGILVSAILLQILLPLILWCCAICRKSWKETDEGMEDERRQQQFNEALERQLEMVRRAESQEELDQGVQEYRGTVQQYEREREQTEIKRKKGLYRNASYWRLTSMHMFFSFYLWLIYLLIYESTAYQGVIFFALYIIAIIMLIIAPIVVLIESIFSHELDYIKNIMEDETAWSYIQRMQQVAPVITMKVECYHWETRTRVVYYTDANGNTQSRTETYQERVVTFVDVDTFSYGSWVDASKNEMPALSTVALTRLKIDLHILFGDDETADEYRRQKEAMLERNEHRDDHMDFSYSEEVPGLAKRISAYVDLRLKPWWIRQRYFWLATLLFMTWPYRWLFRAKTAKNYYDLKKKIYKTTNPPPEVDMMDPVALLQQRQKPILLQDHVNPSFSMSELPSAEPPPPPYSSVSPVGIGAPLYPPSTSSYSSDPPYPPNAPVGTPSPPYPPTASGSQPTPPYLPTGPVGTPAPSHSTSAPPGTQAPFYPPTAGTVPYPPNQGTGQAFPAPVMPQAVPSAPPPSYDAAVNQTNPNSCVTFHNDCIIWLSNFHFIKSMTEETPHFDGDTVTAVAVTALLVAILIQFSLPFVLYFCAYCMKTCKTCIEAKQERKLRRELEEEVDRWYLETETAARSKSNEELAKCVQHYHEAVERRDEALKIKRQKGFYRNVTLVRLVSLVAYVSFFMWVAVFVACEMSKCSKYGPSWSYLRVMGFVMLAISPIIVLIESAFSHELDYINNILEDQSAWTFIQNMHLMNPEITIMITCYHFETKTRASSPSEPATSSNKETKLVVTFEQDYPFTYGCCVDASDQELPPLEQGYLTRIKVDPYILLGDSQTKREFAEQQERLVAINKHRDKNISMSIKKEIPGLDKRFSAYADLAAKSWWIRPRYFWLASVLFMSWPYRWIFRARTPKIHYALTKKIYKRNTPPKKDSMDKSTINDILRRHGRVLPDENLQMVLIEQV